MVLCPSHSEQFTHITGDPILGTRPSPCLPGWNGSSNCVPALAIHIWISSGEVRSQWTSQLVVIEKEPTGAQCSGQRGRVITLVNVMGYIMSTESGPQVCISTQRWGPWNVPCIAMETLGFIQARGWKHPWNTSSRYKLGLVRKSPIQMLKTGPACFYFGIWPVVNLTEQEDGKRRLTARGKT